MRKIKNFRINLRQREILRLLKATGAVSEITPQLEQAVSQEVQRLSKTLAPAALYDSLPKDKLPPEIASVLPLASIASTIFLTTVNETLDTEVKEAQRRQEAILSQILHCLALEALEQTANFIGRLLAEEARQESCELLERMPLPQQTHQSVFTLLPGDKIGVHLTGTSSMQPLYSSCGIIPWSPVKKKTK